MEWMESIESTEYVNDAERIINLNGMDGIDKMNRIYK